MNKTAKLFIVILCLAQIYCGSKVSIPPIQDFTAPDENQAWLVTGVGKVFHFTNGGESIEEVKFKSKVVQIYFLNSEEGWVYDKDNVIWTTTNGGKDWQPKLKPSGTDCSSCYLPIVFTNSQKGWILGAFHISHTEDGGSTWSKVYPTPQFEYSTFGAQPWKMHAVDSEVVWLGLTEGKVLKTIDAGKNWEQVNFPGKRDIRVIHAIHAFNANECFVAGINGGLYYTNDAGRTWQKVFDTEDSLYMGIKTITFADRNNGWFAGHTYATSPDDPNPIRAVLYKTNDGGKSWTKLETDVEDTQLTKIKFINHKIGWMIGNRTVYRSNDGGETWKQIIQVEKPLTVE